MKKLELKHLSGYLPYKLGLWHSEWKEVLIMDSNGCKSYSLSIYDVSKYAKPILHPLSDLTNDTCDFIYNKEVDYSSIIQWINLDIESRLSSKFSLLFWNDLYKYHFDIHGLIEKGLAIDINTLK